MIIQRSPNQRASRVAIAGSIYMRRASIQSLRQKYEINQNKQIPRRNSSFGKIVKNGCKNNEKNQQFLLSSRNQTKLPLGQNWKNQLSHFQVCNLKRSITPSFQHFDSFQNTRIKQIQEKYKSTLEKYQNKKKIINSELQSLKNCNYLPNDKKTEKAKCMGTQSKIKQNIKQYDLKSRQLIIQKLSAPSKKSIIKKKDKIIETYPNFFEGLRNQIVLEEQLRVMKSWISTQKKAQVLQLIKQKNMCERQQQILELDSQQYDPFQIKKQSQLSASTIAQKIAYKLKQCQQNWQSNICNLKVSEAKQIFGRLNFQKTSQISMKSFVRELSFVLEKHLRNRDLHRIYKRFLPLDENNFIKITTKQK